MNHTDIADRIEQFIRSHFRVAPGDSRFSRTQPLFDMGYVDSVGVVELLAFVAEEFCVEVADELLTSDEFSSIEGIAAIVCRLSDDSTQSLPPAPPIRLEGAMEVSA
jgi:acyl carrier protein